jgi:hypothetical protein
MDEEPEAREFPIIRTMAATDVNASGATLRGELVKKGDTPTTVYGFLWSTDEPLLNGAKKITLGEDIGSGSFGARVDHSLAKGIDYNIRAFAMTDDQTIYGNIVVLRSEGSTHCPWSLEMDGIQMNGWSHSYGSADNGHGYITFQSSEIYVFDPEKNEISKSANFPEPGNSGTRFTAVTVGNSQYFFSDTDRILYKHTSGTWSQESYVPFYYGYFGGYYHGYAIGSNIYILSSTQSYMYNLQTKTWQSRAKIPMGYGGYSVGGTDLAGKAYVMTTDKNIWEYNAEADSWIIKTKFPGSLHDKIVSFSHGDKIYFGLSHHDHTADDWIDESFWSYDPKLDRWETLMNFPVEKQNADLFFFSLKGKLYIGNGRSSNYQIWKFDPSKI